MDAKQVDSRIKSLMGTVRKAFRSVVKRVNTSGSTTKIQLAALEGEIVQDAELMQHFGFTSHPPINSDAIVIPLGGKTSHGIIIATENGSYRVKSLKEGEVSIYNQDGASITLKKGKIIDVDCTDYNVKCENYNVTASNKSSFDTPNLETSKLLTAQGTINGNGGMTIQGTTESGAAATFTGTLIHNGGYLSSNGVVLHLHTHSYTIGSTNTGLPNLSY
ncbi:phage baseplate assembly protein V [Neisseria sp. Ec49-e6-T10]|uniref:phage baseplate assembly protein V n=1 Tax=Neisseria sp. Ec49-e6-T10 TaxID=3140744 RepID=UPI003EBCA366